MPKGSMDELGDVAFEQGDVGLLGFRTRVRFRVAKVDLKADVVDVWLIPFRIAVLLFLSVFVVVSALRRHLL
jgi:hypothetical protein